MNNPSDLHAAIEKTLKARLSDEVRVKSYADFEAVELCEAQVLIEFESSDPAPRGNDGRYGHTYHLTIHGVIARSRKNAALEAVNMAAAIERVTEDNLWGLAPVQIDFPQRIQAAPSLFKQGDNGFEAWGVSFSQTIYLGQPLLEMDPLIKQIWAVTTEDNIDESDNYEAI